MHRFLVLCLLVGSWGLAPAGHGQQVGFSAQRQGESVAFVYRWKAREGDLRELNFKLPVDDLGRGDKEFQPFDNSAANAYAYQAAEKKAKDLSVGGVTLQMERHGSRYELMGKAPPGVETDGLIQQVEDAREKAMDDYVRRAFYTNVGGNVIMPDHRRIAARYAPALLPVEQAIKAQTAGLGVRDTANWILSFLQAIPYDLLNDRRTSNGAGFQTPYGLLLRNRGDCDTKSVAMAALLHGLFPQLRLAMVYVPDHAFLAMAMPQGPKDYALELGGTVFVLMDPTGPEMLKVGEVAPRALAALNGGQYSYQEIGF